jgi:hypothetical protein
MMMMIIIKRHIHIYIYLVTGDNKIGGKRERAFLVGAFFCMCVCVCVLCYQNDPLKI